MLPIGSVGIFMARIGPLFFVMYYCKEQNACQPGHALSTVERRG